MLCSNAEGASLKLCNFEDPSGLKANLEGEILSIITFSKVRTDHKVKSPTKQVLRKNHDHYWGVDFFCHRIWSQSCARQEVRGNPASTIE